MKVFVLNFTSLFKLNYVPQVEIRLDQQSFLVTGCLKIKI